MPIFLLAKKAKKKFIFPPTSYPHKKPVKSLHFGTSAECYHEYYYRVTDIYRKLTRENSLVSQGITIESDGSWFKPH